MSIQTELARIKGAKADLKLWVEENGVVVPDGTLIDGLVTLAKTVETGGGGGDNIMIGSFTPTETITESTPIIIDVAFPKNELPLMYCVFEDTRKLKWNDTSHTDIRILHLIASKQSGEYYWVISGSQSAGSFALSVSKDNVYSPVNGFNSGGGNCSSMSINISGGQIRFGSISVNGLYLQGRTYYYVLYWGD